jgi:hypothetical protein
MPARVTARKGNAACPSLIWCPDQETTKLEAALVGNLDMPLLIRREVNALAALHCQ